MATAKKARKRTRRKGEGTGEHILETALGLFRDKGFDATTMRDVARAAIRARRILKARGRIQI